MKVAHAILFLAPLLGLTACVAPSPAVPRATAPTLPAVSASPAPVAAMPASVPTPKIGPVEPPPAGCLSLVFIAPDDDRRALRNPRGRIADVLSTQGTKEPVLARISWDELEDLVPRIAGIVASGDAEPLSHIPGFYSQGHIPGPAAWEYLKRYLKDNDEFWTYGEGETGLLVIRDNHLLCMMSIKVPFED